MRRSLLGKRAVVVVGAALAVAPMVGAGVAGASGGYSFAPRVLYVSPNGSAWRSGRSCWDAKYRTINAAIAAAPTGATVAVCGGTYHEDAVVNKRLRLEGVARNAVIDATGQAEVVPGAGGNGITVLAAGSTVANLTVLNAPGDGILVGGVDNVTVTRNTSNHNGGFGIDLNSASYSHAYWNTTDSNTAGGINLANDVGAPASHNLVANNVANNNTNGCGIVLADHTGAGVFSNTIIGNITNGNGLVVEGAGIVLASPVPGGSVRDNLVSGNFASGNGLAGVTLHSHLPGQNLNGNVVTRNVIGTNNLDGDDPGIASPADRVDSQTTGVLVASAGPLSITVAQNVIAKNYYGIWTAGPVTVSGAHQNLFLGIKVPFFAAS